VELLRPGGHHGRNDEGEVDAVGETAAPLREEGDRAHSMVFGHLRGTE